MKRLTITLVALALSTAGPVLGQTASERSIRPVPFKPGERLDFSLGYGPLPAGSMAIRIADLETFEGRPAYHIVFTAETNAAVSFVYELATNEESWFDAAELYSLRYTRHAVENDKVRDREYWFDQENNLRIEPDGETKPASPRAVDQLSMMYYIRLLPLRVGAKFVLENSADPNDNPLTIRVVKRERLKVPAGTFETYQVELDFRTDSGIFKKGGENRVWLTADEARIPVKLTSKIGLGSIAAELVDFALGRSVSYAR